jgi:dihydropyrimidinase
MARVTQCPLYIVHVSAKQSLEHIENAQKKGFRVFAETCPQYLIHSDSVYEGNFEKTAPYVLSPPIRPKSHRKYLWKALSDNVIQTVGTDHCPFHLKRQKDLGRNDFTKIPNGAGGAEFRLALLYTYGVLEGRITINQMIDMCSTQPAKIFGLYQKKGDLKPGFDADIVIWNPESDRILSAEDQVQNCDSCIYEGIHVRGDAEMVFVNGRLIYKKRIFTDETVRGKYIFRERIRFK